MGPMTQEFERRVAKLVGAQHVIGVSNCSAALHLAIAVLDVGPGDEVILPSLTHVACGHAILAAGATPVFCDVEPTTASLDPGSIAAALTPRTVVISPMHYGGFACRMDEILGLAAEHGCKVVDDAAHAFGSFSAGRPIGSLGDLTCFSFDPLKIVTCGEGGAIATDDDSVADRLRASRNLGASNDSWKRRNADRPWFYESAEPGMRYHLPDINSAIGLAQLDRLEELVGRRRELVERYRDALSGVPGIFPLEGDLEQTSPFLFAARVTGGRRDTLVGRLAERGVQAWVHFVPLHLQPAFTAHARELPVTEQLYRELVSLPLFPEMTDAQQDTVVEAVRDALRLAA